MDKVDYDNITGYLSACDPVLADLIEKVGPPKIEKPASNVFMALLRSIVSQQLHTKAAATIYARLLSLLDGEISPEAICKIPYDALRSAGLSHNKANCVLDFAQKASAKEIRLDPSYMKKQSDDEIVKSLCQVKGIGTWTVQMLLIFQLLRPDVWPSADLGVRRGYGLAWETDMPTPKQLDVLGEKFKPYRSIAAWYCWRAVDIMAGSGPKAQAD